MVAPAGLLANEPEFEFEAGPYSSTELHVVGWQAVEELSRPFELKLELAAADDANVEPEKAIDKDAMLTIHIGSDEARHIRGIVKEMKAWDAGSGAGHRRYHATVVPALWRIDRVQRSRVFQDASVADIIKQVLDAWKIEHKLPGDDKKSERATGGGGGAPTKDGSTSKRNYCVQYRESDLAFLSRLCEEEGLFFYFEHDKKKHVVVFSEKSSGNPPIPGGSSVLPFRPASGMAADGEAVQKIVRAHRVQPGAVMLRDFRFHQPGLDLDAKLTADGADPALEIYDYPGEYPSPSIGKALAKVRLEEHRANARLAEGETSCRRFGAGFLFELRGHDDHAHNLKYFIRSVEHVGRQPEVLPHFTPSAEAGRLPAYQAKFTCQPASIPFRPARATPRPSVSGVQTALVVGPKGEEIYCDKHARIKVQFHWDREGKANEKSSCWIRVAQSWAGPGWGALQIPRVGQEVVVTFLEGDPDRPLVTGRVYNGHNPPTVQLPDDKHKSGLRSNSTPGGGGANEIQFDDSKGSELFYQHAQKDLSIVVKNDKEQKIGGNEKLHVTKDRTKEVGGNQSLTVTKNDNTKVDGEQSLEVAKDRSVTVGGSHHEKVSGTQTVLVGGNHALTVGLGSLESIGAAKALTVGGGYATTVGAAMIENVGGAKVEMVGAAKVEQVGARKTESVAGNRATTIKGALVENIGKDYKVTVGHDFVVNVDGKLEVAAKEAHSTTAKDLGLAAEDQLSITVGSVEVHLKKNGDALLKGTKVEIDAKSKVFIKGSKIEEN